MTQIVRSLNGSCKTPLGNTGLNCKNQLDKIHQVKVDGSVKSFDVSLNENLRSTGLNSEFSVFIHWIQGVLLVPEFEVLNLVKFVSASTKEAYVNKIGKSFCGGLYPNHYLLSGGTKIAYGESKKIKGFYDVWVSIPGTPCERMGLRNCWRLMLGLSHTYNIKYTRIDAKLRLSQDILSFDDLAFAYHNKYFSHFRVKGGHQDSPKSSKSLEESHSYYFGNKKECDSSLRIYDPEVNHGVVNSIDLELVLKDKKAILFAEQFLIFDKATIEEKQSLNQDLVLFIAGVVLGSIDFVDKSQSPKYRKYPRFLWWQKVLDFCKDVSLIRITVPAPNTPFFSKIRWLKKSVVPSLTAMCIAYGDDDFYKMLKVWIDARKKSLNQDLMLKVFEYQQYTFNSVLAI